MELALATLLEPPERGGRRVRPKGLGFKVELLAALAEARPFDVPRRAICSSIDKNLDSTSPKDPTASPHNHPAIILERSTKYNGFVVSSIAAMSKSNS